MKFKLDRGRVEKSLEVFNSIIDVNHFCPEYQGILLQVTPNKVIFIGTNGDLSARSEVDIESFQDFGKDVTFLIPYYYLKNAVKEFEGPTIDVESVDGGVLIFSDMNIEYKLNLIKTDTYPEIDFTVIGPEIKIAASELKEMVKNTVFASSNRSENVVFSSCYLSLNNRELSVVATDNFRLATDSVTIENDRSIDVVVLAKNLKDLINIEHDKEVFLYVSRFKISIVYDNIVIQTKVLDIPYKDTSGVFPANEDLTRTIFIKKEEILKQFSKISVTLNERNRKVRMWTEGDFLHFSSYKDNVGNTECKTNSFKSSGEPFTIAFDLKYFKEALQPFAGEVVIFLNKQMNKIVIVSKSRVSNRQIVSPQRSDVN